MAKNKLEAGQSRIGYAWDGKISEPYPAMLRDRNGRIELVVPFDSTVEPLRRRYTGDFVTWGDDPDMTLHDYEIPDPIWFADAHGFACLMGTQRAGISHIGGGSTTVIEATLRVRFAVFSGDPTVDYSSVHGLMSRIEGLERWYGVKSVASSFDGLTAPPSDEITVTIKQHSEVRLDHRLNLAAVAGAKWQMSGGVGKTSIEDACWVRTKVQDSRALTEHLDLHRAIQELVQISAWQRLGFAQISAMHERDPQRVLSGEAVAPRWAEVSTYALPRPTAEIGRLQFLFSFDDIGAAGVRRWLKLRDSFGRGINAMTFFLRHGRTSIDGEISDCGIGLEEIGHRIRAAQGLPALKKHHLNLEAIADEVAFLLPFDGKTWATESTAVYNGVKHADLPDPGIDAMLSSRRQDRIVFRTWIAHRLGVKAHVIQSGQWLLDRS